MYVRLEGNWYRIVFDEIDRRDVKKAAEVYYRQAKDRFCSEIARGISLKSAKAEEAVRAIAKMRKYANNLGLMEWLIERI